MEGLVEVSVVEEDMLKEDVVCLAREGGRYT